MKLRVFDGVRHLFMAMGGFMNFEKFVRRYKIKLLTTLQTYPGDSCSVQGSLAPACQVRAAAVPGGTSSDPSSCERGWSGHVREEARPRPVQACTGVPDPAGQSWEHFVESALGSKSEIPDLRTEGTKNLKYISQSVVVFLKYQNQKKWFAKINWITVLTTHGTGIKETTFRQNGTDIIWPNHLPRDRLLNFSIETHI